MLHVELYGVRIQAVGSGRVNVQRKMPFLLRASCHLFIMPGVFLFYNLKCLFHFSISVSFEQEFTQVAGDLKLIKYKNKQ